MQIIIPMSGQGARFKAAGYDKLKPLIEVNGKTIIEYVVDMFPGDHSFIFVCRADHNEQYNFAEYLPTIAPGAKVITCEPHKLGPVYAALQAEAEIKDDEAIILSYCDYYMDWDFNDFVKDVTESGDDGNVICYTGFHPHLLHKKNLYAGCRVDEDLNLLEIREKYTFEEDKTLGEHSVGAYYFKSGALMKEYFKKAIEKDQSLNGEYYASLVYPVLIEDGLKVKVYDKVKHFCQWGTPEDLEEFLYWSDIFTKHNYK